MATRKIAPEEDGPPLAPAPRLRCAPGVRLVALPNGDVEAVPDLLPRMATLPHAVPTPPPWSLPPAPPWLPIDPATQAFVREVDPAGAAALESAALRDTLALTNRLLYKLGKR